MRIIGTVTLLALGACAAGPAPSIETGYPTGSLAVAAIERGDWTAAETLLNRDDRVSADDPARLINLGRVYMATGRRPEAIAAWTAALAVRPALVETAGGRMVRTDQLAREALEHYRAPVVTASR